jgi:putative hydrolase
MSLLEGHASYVMNTAAVGRITELERMRRALSERRRSTGAEKAFQRAIGLESKVQQYDAGERFVREVVDAAGWETFNRVWASETELPTIDEIPQPERWLRRVAGA